MERAREHVCIGRTPRTPAAAGRCSLPTATLDPPRQRGWQRRCPLWPHCGDSACRPTNLGCVCRGERRRRQGRRARACTQVKETKRRTSEPLKGRVGNGNGRADEARREGGRQETTTLLSECGRPRIGRLVGRSVRGHHQDQEPCVRVIYEHEHEHRHSTAHSRMQAKRAASEARPHLGIWNWTDGMAAEEIRHLATEMIIMSLHCATNFLSRREFNHLSTPNEPSVVMYRNIPRRKIYGRTAFALHASDKSFFTPSLSQRPEAAVARPPR